MFALMAIVYSMFFFHTVYADALLSHGESCDNNSNSCETGTICSSDKNNASRCLCNNDEYRTDSNRCLSMKNLLVTDVKTKQIRTNSVELEWLNITFDRTSSRIKVSYDNLSTLVNGNSGAKIYNLKPNTTYTFTIHVFIYSDQWYSERNGPKNIHNARTLTTKNYGDQCNKITDECQEETTCVLDSKNISRCICNKDQYRNDDNKCATLGELTVKNINVALITTNSIKLSWCIKSIKKYSAQYRVSYGTHNNVYGNDYGVVIDNLQPQTVYTFEVKVVIPPETYYGVIEGPPNTQTKKTALIHQELTGRIQSMSTFASQSSTLDTSTKKVTTSDSWMRSSTMNSTLFSTTKFQPSSKKPMKKDSENLTIPISACVAVFALVFILLILFYTYRRKMTKLHLSSSLGNSGRAYKHVSISISPDTVHTELNETGLQHHRENEVFPHVLLATNNKYETTESVAYSKVHKLDSGKNKVKSPYVNKESTELIQSEKPEAVYSHLVHNCVQGPKDVVNIYSGY